MSVTREIQPPFEHDIPQRPPWRNIMLLLGLILLGMSLGNLLAMLMVMLLSLRDGGMSIEQISTMLNTPEQFPHAWWYIMLIQAVVHIFTFLLPGVVYWRWSEQHRVEEFVKRRPPESGTFFVAFLTTLVFMPFNSWMIEWNGQLQLPSILKPLQDWMLSKETELAEMTQFLTSYTAWGQLVVALLVVAVIPAFGEEVLFRGVIQRKIFHKIANVHFAVWVTAALFSAIHFQFYGFVPRMFLGAMFGYMYAWTRNLWIPIFAHFINNGFTLIIVFLNQRGVLNFEINQTQSSVPWTLVLVSLGMSIFLLLYLKNSAQRAGLHQQ
jgi:uncharacterized protein